MREDLSNDNNDNDNSEKVPNTELIYNYTQELLKTQNESLNRLDTKLSVFLAFIGVLVRFSSDLSVVVSIKGLRCYSCNLLQILAYISLGVAALLLCLGLTARFRGSVISPKALMRYEWYFAKKIDISDYIISAWIEAEEEYQKLGLYKSRKLNIAVTLIAFSLVFIIINALIKIIWG